MQSGVSFEVPPNSRTMHLESANWLSFALCDFVVCVVYTFLENQMQRPLYAVG